MANTAAKRLAPDDPDYAVLAVLTGLEDEPSGERVYRFEGHQNPLNAALSRLKLEDKPYARKAEVRFSLDLFSELELVMQTNVRVQPGENSYQTRVLGWRVLRDASLPNYTMVIEP